jgi:acyl carrier protein
MAINLLTPVDEPQITTNQAATACLLFSTSGTTGTPKLVIHHDSDLVAQAHRHVGSPLERFACLASIEHNFAKRHRLYCLAVGATNVFLDDNEENLVAQCQLLNVNVLHVSAFQAQRLLAATDINQLANIRLKLGGSHVPDSLRCQLRENITEHLQAGYGTTETGAIAFTEPNDFDKGESVGKPLPGIEVRVVSADRKDLNIGEHGELAIRCKGMFRGYLDNPDVTAARLHEGWFYTGDIGYIDHQNRIHLSGRSDDMFVFNSMNIYPQDIESTIRQYQGIIDVAVLPKSSNIHGNIPIALVVFDRSAKVKLSKLEKFSKEKLGIRSPRQFIIVEEIPRNAAGKISRQEALSLSVKSNQIRKDIIQALDSSVIEHLKPAFITDFEKGNIDIRFREIEMDSISQMDLLITLEVNYNVIITPLEFTQFRSLGEIVARVLSPHLSDEEVKIPVSKDNSPQSTSDLDNKPYVVKLFQRIFHYCPTVAQLNRALTTLEYRLTPIEIELLHKTHAGQQLLPDNTANKFHSAFNLWLQRIQRLMLSSGKSQAEPFTYQRVAPTVSYFKGPSPAETKTLLICFSEAGGRSMMMPNAVLIQHTNATLYDLLIISEPLNEGYRLGVPHLGNNVTEVIEWIAKLNLVSNYRSLRTLGCSAGCFPSVIAGKQLKADLAVSVGGRFHSERHPVKILERIFTTWLAMRKKHILNTLMCYDKNISRDKQYAKIIGWLSTSGLVAIELKNEKLGHFLLQQLAEHGQLATFLERTIFAELSDEIFVRKRANVTLSLPENKIRANK